MGGESITWRVFNKKTADVATKGLQYMFCNPTEVRVVCQKDAPKDEFISTESMERFFKALPEKYDGKLIIFGLDAFLGCANSIRLSKERLAACKHSW